MNRWRCVACVLAAAAARAPAGDWPMLAHDCLRTGATPEAVEPPVRRAWVRYFHQEGLMPSVQPVQAGGRIYLGTLGGSFHCLDAATGRDVWRAEVAAPVFHTACAAGGRVVFGCGDGRIVALEADTGKPAWSRRTGAPIWNAPLAHDGLAIIGGRDGVLYAVGLADGGPGWTYDAGAPICQSPAMDPGRGVVYVTGEDMVVHAVDARTGQAKWRSPKLHGVTARSFHPVVAPDGAVMVTTVPYYAWDRARRPLDRALRRLFGTAGLGRPDTRYPGEYVRLPNWRFSRQCNRRMADHAREVFLRPGYFDRLTAALRAEIEADPPCRCLFVLDPETGRQRPAPPVLYTAFAKSAFTPPLVAPDGRVVSKWLALLPSTFTAYQRWVNLAYLTTADGTPAPVFDETRVDSGKPLHLIGDESCQLTAAGPWLLNLAVHHGEHLNGFRRTGPAGDRGRFERFYTTHTHRYGMGVLHRIVRGKTEAILPGEEDLTRGFGAGNPGEHATGNHTCANMPVIVADGRIVFAANGRVMALVHADSPPQFPRPATLAEAGIEPLSDAEVATITDTWPVNWDYVSVKPPGGWKNHLINTPGRITLPPGVRGNPDNDAAEAAASLPDAQLDACIRPVREPPAPPDTPAARKLRARLVEAAREIIAEPRWMPYRFQGGKHPGDYMDFYADPGEELLALARALPHLPDGDRKAVIEAVADRWAKADPICGLRDYRAGEGAAREPYRVPPDRGRVFRMCSKPGPERAYAAWLWGCASGRWDLVRPLWPRLRKAPRYDQWRDDRDWGNRRCAALIATCRLARRFEDEATLAAALPAARAALRARLAAALRYPRGNVAGDQPAPGLWRNYLRWVNLTPEVAGLIRRHAPASAGPLVREYTARLRPYWFLTWGPITPASREASMQLPRNTWDAFAARAWIERAAPADLAVWCDIPACKADTWHLAKLALTLDAMGRASRDPPRGNAETTDAGMQRSWLMDHMPGVRAGAPACVRSGFGRPRRSRGTGPRRGSCGNGPLAGAGGGR